jgi:hypothetical protein
MRVRKIVGSVLVVVAALGLPACRSAAPAVVSSSASGAVVTGDGATSGAAAITAFLAAARVPEVGAMARLFGTTNGPITEREGSAPVEKRMRALACYLTHDDARIIEDLPGVGAGRAVTVELRQRELTRRARFTTVPGPRGRWFVESFDINALADFCRPTGRNDGRSGGR